MKFKLNSAGVKALLQGTEMQAVLNQTAQAVSMRAGDGYEAEPHVGQRRAYANVYPATQQAYRENNEFNTLLKALHD